MVNGPRLQEHLRHIARQPVAAAFAASLLLHIAVYGGWMWGNAIGLWDHQATWLFDFTRKNPEQTQARPPDSVLLDSAPKEEIPLTFIEVDPTTATPAPPPETTFYGAQNSKAANPDPLPKSPVPKADGSQKQVPRLADVPRPEPTPPPTPPEPPTPKEPLQPKPLAPAKPLQEPPTPTPGDLAKVERFLTPTQTPTDPAEKAVVRTRPRPRTLEEARQRNTLAGRKLQQDGGVNRPGILSFDVKATEFGSYDAAFIAAVQKRWYDLIDSRASFEVPRSGKVTVIFRLTYDGIINDLTVTENEVGEILGLICQRALLDPAPYAHWPSDMRRKMGNSRDVKFTFYYN